MNINKNEISKPWISSWKETKKQLRTPTQSQRLSKRTGFSNKSSIPFGIRLLSFWFHDLVENWIRWGNGLKFGPIRTLASKYRKLAWKWNLIHSFGREYSTIRRICTFWETKFTWFFWDRAKFVQLHIGKHNQRSAQRRNFWIKKTIIALRAA